MRHGTRATRERCHSARSAPRKGGKAQSALLCLLVKGKPLLFKQGGDDLQIIVLAWGKEGDAQTEALGKGELFVHGVGGVHVAPLPFGKAFADKMAAVGGGAEKDVWALSLRSAFKDHLQ